VLSPSYLSRKFKERADSAGLPPIRFHDLRHTSASLALEAGVALKTVSDRLGHSTTAITADLYTHVSPAVAQAAADAIANSIHAEL
jgi:integrase